MSDRNNQKNINNKEEIIKQYGEVSKIINGIVNVKRKVNRYSNEFLNSSSLSTKK